MGTPDYSQSRYYVKGKEVSKSEFNAAKAGGSSSSSSSSSSSGSSGSRYYIQGNQVSKSQFETYKKTGQLPSNIATSSAVTSQNSVASQLFGRSYSSLSDAQKQQVRSSIETAQQKLGIRGQNVDSKNIQAAVQEMQTEEARQRQQELITKTQQVQTQQQLQQQAIQQAQEVEKQRLVQGIFTQGLKPDITQNPLTQSYAVQQAIQKTNERIAYEEAQAKVRNTLNKEFSDEKILQMFKEESKNVQEELSTGKGKIPTTTANQNKQIEKWKDVKVNRGNYDLLNREVPYSVRATASYQTWKINPNNPILAQTTPIKATEEELKQLDNINSLNTNLGIFYAKEGAKIGAITLGTAGLVYAGGALVGAAAAGSTAAAVTVGTAKAGAGGYAAYQVAKANDLSTGKTIVVTALGATAGAVLPTSILTTSMKVVYPASVAYRVGNIALNPYYKDRPTARILDTAYLGAELVGVGVGVSALKGTQIQPETYKADPQVNVETTQGGGYKLIQQGTIQTKGGKTYKVSTTVTSNAAGEGTYKTFITQGRGGKLVILDAGKANIDTKLFSKSNIEIIDLGQGVQGVLKSSPLQPTKVVSKLDLTQLKTNAGDLYILKTDLTSAVGTPFKSKTTLTLTSNAGVQTYSIIEGNIQTLTNNKIQILSTQTSQTTLNQNKPYKFIETKSSNILQAETNLPSQTQRFKISTSKPILDLQTSYTTTNINTKPFGNLQAMGKKGLVGNGLILEQPLISTNKPTLITSYTNIGNTAILNINQPSAIIAPLVFSKTAESNIQDNRLKNQQLQKFKPISIEKPITEQTNEIENRIIEDEIQVNITKTGGGYKQEQIQDQEEIIDVPDPIIPDPIIPNPDPIKPDPIIPPFDLPRQELTPRQTITGYDVFVREKGKFKKITTNSLTKKEALDFGAFRVSTTARASFYIRPSTNMVGSINKSMLGSFSKFRSNFAVKNNIFIEKRNRRIKSVGEKAEITFKGIAKRKKMSGLGIKKIRW